MRSVFFYYFLVLTLICFQSSPLFCQVKWQKLNGPPGGIIGSIGVNETGLKMVADTRIIVSPEYSIIYYSSDSGQTWSKSPFLFGDRVTDLIYANDGSVVASIYSNGIYRSTNNGIDWQYTGLSGQWIWSLTKDSSGILFAGSDLIAKLYRSTNHGQSWEYLYQPPGDRVGTLHTSKKTNHIFAGLSQTIYRSSNIGNTWEVADSGITTSDIFYGITSDTIGNLYATTLHGGEFYWSVDDGNYWVNTDTNGVLVNTGKSSLIKVGNHLLCTTWYGVIRSIDHGYNWQSQNDGVYIDWSNVLAIDLNNNIYLGTHGSGIFKSTDQGENWFPLNNGLNSALLLDLTFDDQENLYAAAWNGGLHKSTDSGNSWQVIHNGLTNLNLQCLLYSRTGILYAGTENGLFQSIDYGNSWERTGSVGQDELYELRDNSIGYLYAIDYGNGLWRSTDGGDNWQLVSSFFSNQSVFGLTLDSNDHIYAGTRLGKIYKSTNHGNDWQLITNGLTSDKTVLTITITPDGNVYAGTAGDGVFRSSDGGQNWNVVNNGIASQNIRFITSNTKNEVFTSSFNGGLYYSNDSANNWINISHELDRTEISSIIFDNDGYLYLATVESMFRSTDSVFTFINNFENNNYPLSFSLKQNCPNPFNSTTMISYYIEKSSTVSLKIYDLLGKEIKTLVDNSKAWGLKSVTWDGRDDKGNEVASGIYIYRLESNRNQRISKKMIFIR